MSNKCYYPCGTFQLHIALIQRGGGKRPCEARQPSRRERCSPGDGANSANALVRALGDEDGRSIAYQHRTRVSHAPPAPWTGPFDLIQRAFTREEPDIDDHTP